MAFLRRATYVACEAFELYFRRLKPDGVLAVHISNQYLDLTSVVAGAATWFNKAAVKVTNRRDEAHEVYRAVWILVGSRQGFLGKSEVEDAGAILPPGSGLLWTGDYSSLFRILVL